MSEETLITEDITSTTDEAPESEAPVGEAPTPEPEPKVVPGKYELNLPEELAHVEIPDNDPLLIEAQEFAQQHGMSQETFDQMIQLYAKTHILDEEATAQHRQTELEALGKEGDARLTRLAQWGQANLSEEQFEGFKEIATSAKAVETLEHLVSMTRAGQLSPQAAAAPVITADDVRAMQFEVDEYGNRRVATDPEFRKRYEALKNKVWGSSEARRVIG